jgi:hypothetical protein
MRYRIEVIDGYPMVHNVETNTWVGVILHPKVPDPDNPGHRISVTEVLDADIKTIAFLRGENIDPLHPEFWPMSEAISVAALSEEHRGFPHFRNIKEPTDPLRIEHVLGELMADAACVLAQAVLEQRGGTSQPETKHKLADLLDKISDIAWASTFGSFNGEIHAHEPYFSNAPLWNERMHFDEAAKHFGLFHLRRRVRGVDNVFLEKLLSEVVGLVHEFVKRMVEPEPSSVN